MRYDKITTFNAIPRKHKFAEVKKKERNDLTSIGKMNFHRTSHRIKQTICAENISTHLTSHGTVAFDHTNYRTRWRARHGGRSEDVYRTKLSR